VATFSDEVLVWTYYFEKPNRKLDGDKLADWDEAMEDSLGPAIDEACTKLQIAPTKANRSQLLALAVVTRGSELSERVMSAARFYKKNVLSNEIL
jgi:hypothetical protein